MEQQPQTIRVGVLPAMLGMEGDTPIVVEIPANTPPEQIRTVALAQVAANQPKEVSLGQNQLGFQAGPKQLAVTLPPVSGDVASAIGNAVPQMVGLAASFHPAARSAKMAFGIPAATEMTRQVVSGEGLDPVSAAGQGSLGFMAHGLGQVGSALARGGMNTVRRALNLGNSPFAYNEAAEQMLPKLAVREGSSMTKAGVETARRRAAETGAGGLEDLAEVLEKGRYDAANASSLSGGGLMTMITRFLDNPRQLKIGQALTKAGDVDPTAHQGGDIIARILALLAAGARDPVVEEPQPTRRRQ